MLGLLVVCVALAAVHLTPAIAIAQSTVSTDVGLRTWVTNGYTKWNFGVATVNPLSELRWRGTEAVILEGHTDVAWRRLVLMFTLGGGRPENGTLLDDDFLANGRQFHFSRTRSEIDGSHIFYGMGDVGYRAAEWHDPMSGTRGFVDLFVGYQYWEEEYEAFGFKGVLDLSAFGLGVLPQSIPNSVLGITHTYRFHSARIGARAVVPLGSGFTWRWGVTFLPHTRTEVVDVHHLRSDFRQDPSSRSRADGGFGYQLDAALAYKVWRGLSLEAGYRFWRLESGTGIDTTFFADGTTARSRLNEVIIERGGPYFGVEYRF